MHRILPLATALAMVGCLSSPDAAETGKAALGDDRLRIHGPAIPLSPGQWVTGQVLGHGVVSASVSFDLSGIRVDAEVPQDFWAEVQGYLLDVEAGTDVVVTIEGPKVQTLTKRVGADGSSIAPGNEIHFVAEGSGTHLVMVIPSEIRPGSDHIEYSLVARTTPPPARDAVVDQAPLPFAEAEAWTCNLAFLGTRDGCDCGCGAPDPDCGGLGCAEPGCVDAACAFCYDASGSDVGCPPAQW